MSDGPVRSDCASDLPGLRKRFDVVRDPDIPARAAALIELESEPRHRKKCAALWR